MKFPTDLMMAFTCMGSSSMAQDGIKKMHVSRSLGMGRCSIACQWFTSYPSKARLSQKSRRVYTSVLCTKPACELVFLAPLGSPPTLFSASTYQYRKEHKQGFGHCKAWLF